VYAEGGERHHLPHCHVRWPDDEASVALTTLVRLDGEPLPLAARALLEQHLSDLRAAWDSLNPERPFQ